MKFVIDSDGHVSAAAVAEYGDTLGALVVGCCIAQAMKAWRFQGLTVVGCGREIPFRP